MLMSDNNQDIFIKELYHLLWNEAYIIIAKLLLKNGLSKCQTIFNL